MAWVSMVRPAFCRQVWHEDFTAAKTASRSGRGTSVDIKDNATVAAVWSTNCVLLRQVCETKNAWHSCVADAILHGDSGWTFAHADPKPRTRVDAFELNPL
jgi:hypothetical protein